MLSPLALRCQRSFLYYIYLLLEFAKVIEKKVKYTANKRRSTMKFETLVKQLKYTVLREVAKDYWEGDLWDKRIDIPKRISPGPKATRRCCIYKERAIVAERIKLALGVIRTIRVFSKSSNPPATSVLSVEGKSRISAAAA